MKADVPFDRLAQLFNVNTFVVSQVNPHVVPFLADAAYDYLLAGAGGAGSLLSQASNPAPRGKGTLLHRVEEELRHDVSVSVSVLAKNEIKMFKCQFIFPGYQSARDIVLSWRVCTLLDNLVSRLPSFAGVRPPSQIGPPRIASATFRTRRGRPLQAEVRGKHTHTHTHTCIEVLGTRTIVYGM